MKDTSTEFLSKKDFVLLALTLLCFLVCGVRGFPVLPSSSSGEFATSTLQEVRALCKEALPPVTYFYFALFSGLITVALGLALHMHTPEHRDMANAYLNFGCFILLSGVWMLTDSRIILLIAGEKNGVNFVSFCCFMLMPLPILRYFGYLQPNLRRIKTMNWLYSANTAVFLSFVLLDVNYYLYFISLAVHHLLTILFVLSLIAQKLVDLIRNRGEFRLSAGLTLFFLFCVGAVVLFLMGFTHLYGLLFGLGLLCLIVSVLVKLLRYFISAIKGQLQMELLQEMAYTDPLCQIGNRSAFLQEQEATEQDPTLCYVILDINGLKTINDQLGHSMGDYMIHAAAKVIQSAFSEVGKCYRIGGDEFAVICTGKEEAAISDALQKMGQAIENHNLHMEPKLGVAYGYAIRRSGESVDQLFQEADKAMYANKQLSRGKAER